jgi:hypothetical protein
MTYNSFKKSYKTFIRLNFFSDSQECNKNRVGLFLFIFTITEYIFEKGYSSIFREEMILDVFSKITVDFVKEDKTKFDMLLDLITSFQTIMDIIKLDDDLFSYNQILF